jgi:signal transduction histidine kinase
MVHVIKNYVCVIKEIKKMEKKYRWTREYDMIIRNQIRTFEYFRATNKKTLNRRLLQIVVLIFSLVSSVCVCAQKQEQAFIDSLQTELLNSGEDSNKVNILYNLSFSYRKTDQDKGLEYGKQSLKLAKKMNWNKGKAQAYTSIGRNYHFKYKFDSAIKYYKKALKLWKEIENKQQIGDMYYFIGFALHMQSEFPKALEYYNKSLVLFKEIDNKIDIAESLQNIGIVYWSQSDYPKALEYIKESLMNIKGIGEESEIAKRYHNLALIYTAMGNPSKALEYYFNNLRLFEEAGNKANIATTYNNIGTIYNNYIDSLKALEYYQKALRIQEELGDKIGLAASYYNVGRSNLKLERYKKALRFLNKSISISQELGDDRSIAMSKGIIGEIHFRQFDFEKALQYYNESLRVFEANGDKRFIAIRLVDIGELYFELSKDSLIAEIQGNLITLNLNRGYNLKNSIDNFSKAVQLLEEIGGVGSLISSLAALSDVYAAKGDFERSQIYFKKHIAIRDSIVNQETRTKIANLDAKRENELNQKEIEHLKKENEYQTNITYYFIAVSVLIFTILVVLFFFYRSKQKSNFNLEVKNEIISRANNELEALNDDLADKHWQISRSEKQLKETNATKDKFFSIIAHDLKNPLGAFRDITGLLVNEYDDFTTEDRVEFIVLMNQSAKQLFELLENLLDWSRSQTGKIDFNPQEIDISILIKNNIDLLSGIAERKNIELAMESENETNANVDINMVSTVIRNLTSNAIKFTPKDGKIILSSEISEDEIKVSIRDNGIGISEDDINKLFRIDVPHTTVGTADEKGTGIGLILCKEFIEKNGGKIWVESKKDNGSAFYFTVPIAKI